MKKTLSVAAFIAAACAVVSTASVAQNMPPQDAGPDHHAPGMRSSQPDRGGPGARPEMHRPPMARPGGPGPVDARGPGPAPMDGGWRERGRPLPREYRDRQYVIDNYREYQLQPPPRGYHWVGVNGDYLLVAIGSGVIRDIITGR
ncbi:hypothetical protein WM40_05060 [Robbsia andropogonis]|uniref:Integral membrane protein n=1 Tax=Robbsia andropogonis TaxID=28092 RepID=A0A0F5K3S1_9BURK|nr:RcnB family protein [Robbsia andropogonis]KKB64743.1 hypothetical protein WM40_05060 [Robbsia andropogonis]